MDGMGLVNLHPPARGITLHREHWQAMREHVSREAPYEACGLVAGKDGISQAVYPIPNELRSPVRYRMEPRAQLAAFEAMDEVGWDLLAIYHSHPQGRAIPSAIDIAEAAYPVVYLIWAPVGKTWFCRGYWLERKRVQPVPVRLL